MALATSKAAARLLKLPAAQVLPASTGVIGVELDPAQDHRRAARAWPPASIPDRFDDAARAIMTTDLVPKTAFAEVKLRRGVVRIAGMTKGSGMIHPLMATTLGFVMTDAAFRRPLLRAMLKRVGGAQLQPPLGGWRHLHQRYAAAAGQRRFRRAARPQGTAPNSKRRWPRSWRSLAQAIARDGEGARKFVTILVTGAATGDGAARIARAIANSPLVKTAIAGSDPNWGRILSAAGNAGVAFDPAKTDIRMQQCWSAGVGWRWTSRKPS